MKSRNGLLARIFKPLSELIFYRSTQAPIRFQVSDPTLSESADECLLRRRIQAAAAVLFVAKLAMVIRSFALYGYAAALDGGILICLLGAGIWLNSPRRASGFWLRTIETIMFLGLSLQLGIQLHHNLRDLYAQPPIKTEEITSNAVSFVAVVKDQIINTFGMMMIYGMFIPNTARRAALMVFLMAVTPGVVIAMNQSSRTALVEFRRAHVAAPQIFSGNLLALAIGAGCAIYGTAVMNRWRNRAIQAEELGQYRLREKIGSGGMGDVYLAEHRLLKRVCAVKLIRADVSEDPVMLTRFEREVQATATLTHWNTVQVFDYGQTADGTFFYVMEHLHGRNLKQIVDQTGPMPQERVVFILCQVCNALREAAAHGLVHRDIKPSNVFLAHVGHRFDVVKLLDFGLVRPLASARDADLSATNQVKGSPRYMCPEQAQGQSPDTRGDLYSLGATAYFLLTGRPPFDLENPLQLVIAHATEEPKTLREVGVTISSELESIILKCLRKNPADRFQTPDEMLTALESVAIAGAWNWLAAEIWWQENMAEWIEAEASQSGAMATQPADGLEETVIAGTTAAPAGK